GPFGGADRSEKGPLRRAFCLLAVQLGGICFKLKRNRRCRPPVAPIRIRGVILTEQETPPPGYLRARMEGHNRSRSTPTSQGNEMKLTRSLLAGLAAAGLTITGAQAADLMV